MSRENVEVVRRSLAAFNDGDYEASLSHFAPDAEWEHNVGLGTPMEGTYRGHAALRDFWNRLFEAFEDAYYEIEELRDLGDEVLILGRLSTRGRASGAAVDTPFGAIADFREGVVVRQRFFMDRSRALEAAGLRE
jgi:ketosteroid isomerase-like protein